MPGSSSASPVTGHACSPSNAHASYPATNCPSPGPEPYGVGGMTWPVPPLGPGSAVTSTFRTSGARSSRRCPAGTLVDQRPVLLCWQWCDGLLDVVEVALD